MTVGETITKQVIVKPDLDASNELNNTVTVNVAQTD